MVIEADGLIPLPESSFKRAVDILTRAFWDYELQVYMFPDESKRRKFQPLFIEYALNHGRLYGDVLTTSPNVEGIAVWTHSDSEGHGLLSAFRGGGFKMLVRFGIKQIKKMLRFKEFADSLREKYAPKPHMHVTSIAVDPEKQGQGYCSKTLRPVFEYLDKIRLPCYLETQNERNVSIYEHYGFEIVSETAVPDADMTHWGMVRPPR